MQTIELHLARDDGPEAGEHTGEPLSFDPRDPGSVKRAEATLRRTFGLSVAPALCSEPGSRVVAALRRRVARFAKRLGRTLRPRRFTAETPS